MPMNDEHIGYIYVFLNSSFKEDLLKIGHTSRYPGDRLSELSNTSVPEEFVIGYVERVLNPEFVEQEAHEVLSIYRVKGNREFFKLPLSWAVSAIRKIVQDHSLSPASSNNSFPKFICKRCGFTYESLQKESFCQKCGY